MKVTPLGEARIGPIDGRRSFMALSRAPGRCRAGRAPARVLANAILR
jgi:hypothetical protein